MNGARLLVILAAALSVCLGGPAVSGEKFILLQSTTSTRNSGLLDAILPVFEDETGIEVRVVAVGTGQAIKNARNGDGDVLLVHAPEAEREFVKQGWGVMRHELMYNDFVVLGPASDPADVGGLQDVVAAFRKIAAQRETFVSRGDDSGTHKAERKLWAAAGIDVDAISGTWYRETGAGMGTTFNIAVGMDAYVMGDRASWEAFGSKGKHEVLVERDPRLFNQYGLILVNPERHPHVRAEEGQVFIDWLLGERGQSLIAQFRVNGKQVFFPNSGR